MNVFEPISQSNDDASQQAYDLPRLSGFPGAGSRVDFMMTILRSDNGSPGLVRGGGAGGVNCCTRREEDAKSSIPEDEDAEEDDVEVICPFALVLIVINPPLDAQGTGGAVCLS